jgi:hypothetical protein
LSETLLAPPHRHELVDDFDAARCVELDDRGLVPDGHLVDESLDRAFQGRKACRLDRAAVIHHEDDRDMLLAALRGGQGEVGRLDRNLYVVDPDPEVAGIEPRNRPGVAGDLDIGLDRVARRAGLHADCDLGSRRRDERECRTHAQDDESHEPARADRESAETVFHCRPDWKSP